MAIISNVLYVPTMKHNLLSLRQLSKKGFSMKLNCNVLNMFDEKQRLILRAPLFVNRTFLQIVDTPCLAIGEPLLGKDHMVIGLPSIKPIEKASNLKMCLIEVTSMRGNKYFVSFVDEYTRKLWIFLIVRKIEVLSIFQNFKKLIENQSRKHIKILRIDEGDEYTSRQFEDFCDKNKIIHEEKQDFVKHNKKNDQVKTVVKQSLGKNDEHN
ncbi:hypothetical protein CR513_58386, partial [Mucuna pruriens]